MSDDFYVGYNPKAPSTLAGFIRRVVLGLGVATVGVCVLVLLYQSRSPAKVFEFGVVKPWTGVMTVSPYPALIWFTDRVDLETMLC